MDYVLFSKLSSMVLPNSPLCSRPAFCAWSIFLDHGNIFVLVSILKYAVLWAISQ
jgi:hypothetical protein